MPESDLTREGDAPEHDEAVRKGRIPFSPLCDPDAGQSTPDCLAAYPVRARERANAYPGVKLLGDHLDGFIEMAASSHRQGRRLIDGKVPLDHAVSFPFGPAISSVTVRLIRRGRSRRPSTMRTAPTTVHCVRPARTHHTSCVIIVTHVTEHRTDALVEVALP